MNGGYRNNLMDDTFRQTESLSISLVREYLSRKGLTLTLETLDRELPPTGPRINNRVQLARALCIEKLMRENKESHRPFRSMIEVITQHYVDKSANQKQRNNIQDFTNQSERMYRRVQEKGGVDVPPKQKSQPMKDDIVLEDADEGETVLGVGNVANQRPSSGHVTVSANQRSKYRTTSQVSSNLNDREQQNLKRILKQPRYQLDSISASDLFSSGSVLSSSLNPATKTSSSAEISKNITPNHLKVGHNDVSAEKEFDDTENSRKLVQYENISTPNRLKFEQISKTGYNDVRAEKKADETETRRTSAPKGVSDAAPLIQNDSVAKPKPKSRAELLAMLDIQDPKAAGAKITSSQPPPTAPPNVRKLKSLGDMVLGDVSDEELGLESSVPIPIVKPSIGTKHRDSQPIAMETAKELKLLIFGSSMQQFNDEWKKQGLTFSGYSQVKYGIVQNKGGPCGVMAAIQAGCLQDLLFGAKSEKEIKRLNPKRCDLVASLAVTLATIFWRAGANKGATVALPSGRAYFSGSAKYKADGLTETLILTRFIDHADLCDFMRTNVSVFEGEGQAGVVLALYSAILSRTIDGVRSDMDDVKGKLMGQHFYCTQEMVNLILTGRAVSNVFNDVIELTGADDVTVLRGLSRRNDIGFLSLFEHYNSCQVGTYYKTPKHPIWVVCCESHFSVLFAIRKDLVSDWKVERRFDLFYYDGLANQKEEIKLTIDTSERYQYHVEDEDMVPPLENCIRTKWPGAIIDWNGTEPLL